jgi:hypothetical protein
MTKRFSLLLVTLAASLLATTRAQAALHAYSFVMNGPSESPPNASPGLGTGTAIYDDVALTLQLTASFAGLTGTTTATHFHAITATSGLPDNNPVGETSDQAAAAVTNVGVAVGAPSLPGFPLGVTSGVYSNTLNLNDSSVFNAGFLAAQGGLTGARPAFVNALASGRTYWNIHSSTFNGGEIRGFPVAVIPEPATVGMAAVALMGLIAQRRRG